MTTVGIVGGIGPESTIDYYRRILDAWREVEPDAAPSIVINSIDVRRALRLVQDDRTELVVYLLAAIDRLAGAGVDFAVLSANTPHIVFDELAARSPVPLLSIVEATADEADRLGLRRLLLLGTRFTMDATFFAEVFGRRDITVVSPPEPARSWVHDRYIGELLRGEFRDDTRTRFEAVVDELRRTDRIDGVILGGTELPLLLTTPVVGGVPVLDTTSCHVRAIVARLRDHTALPVPRITPSTRRDSSK